MKRVIRQSVFETNSSSTHSLTIKPCKPNEPIEENCSFELRSKLAKVVWLLGIIDNAESEFEYQLKEERTKDGDTQIKQEIHDELQEYFPQLIDELNMEYNSDFITNADVIELHNKLIDMGYGAFAYGTSYNYLNRYEDICFLQRLRETLINTYAEVENITLEQAMENIKHEAFGLNKNQRDKFLNPETRNEMVKQAKEVDYKFKEILKIHKNKPIEEIIDIYLKEKEEIFYNNRNGKISCSKYFSEGALNDCNCGYDCPSKIIKNICDSLSMSTLPTNEELTNAIKEFLSDKFKVVGVEKYCGEYLIGGNIIY